MISSAKEAREIVERMLRKKTLEEDVDKSFEFLQAQGYLAALEGSEIKLFLGDLERIQSYQVIEALALYRQAIGDKL